MIKLGRKKLKIKLKNQNLIKKMKANKKKDFKRKIKMLVFKN